MVTTDYSPAFSPAPLLRPAASPAPVVVDQPRVPDLSFGSAPVAPRAHLHPGTGWQTAVAGVLVAVVGLGFVIGTSGLGLLALLIAPVVEYFRARKVRALIRGSGVQVGADQLPFIHRCVADFAERLGMRQAPEVYVVEDAVQNGFAVRLGKKNVVMLTDDVIWGALNGRDPRALGFVLGHELAHIALGHTGTLRGLMRGLFRPLARSDEHTADNIAAALVGDRKVAVHGITILTVGPQLLPWVNDDALMRQAHDVWADRLSKKAEKGLTHPLLLRRIANVLGAR